LIILLLAAVFVLAAKTGIGPDGDASRADDSSVGANDFPPDSGTSQAGVPVLHIPGAIDQFVIEEGEPYAESIVSHATFERHEPFPGSCPEYPSVAVLTRELMTRPSRPAHLSAFLTALRLDPAVD
jgi:hypothetical protein